MENKKKAVDSSKSLNSANKIPKLSDNLLWDLLESIPTCVSIWKKGVLLYGNNKYYRSVGVEPGDINKLRDMILNGDCNLVHPEDYDYCRKNKDEIKKELKNGNLFNKEFRMRSISSDVYKWYNTYLVKGKDADSDVTIELDEDITEKKLAIEKLSKALCEKELLLKEIHHRVKNNFQIISSLLRLQLNKATDWNVKDIFMESENRIRSMSLVHESLYLTDDLTNINFAEHIGRLTENLVNSYSGRTKLVKFTIESNGYLMGVDIAIPCSLIINELVSNSFKHGFDDSMDPEINISLSLLNGKYILKITDNGVGFPDSFFSNKNKKTLGIVIVETLAKQLNGNVAFRNNPGAETVITFDIP